MPYKSRRRCLYPGCPELVEAGVRYCARHKPVPKNDNSHYDRRWRAFREGYLARHPLCMECEQAGRLTPAAEIHHIVPLADGGTDREDNLMALCKSCHSRKTSEGSRFGKEV